MVAVLQHPAPIFRKLPALAARRKFDGIDKITEGTLDSSVVARAGNDELFVREI